MGNDRNSSSVVGGYESNAFVLIIMMWSVYQISINSNFAYLLVVGFTAQTKVANYYIRVQRYRKVA